MSPDHIVDLPDSCIPTAVVEVVSYLSEDGSPEIVFRAGGDGSLTTFLGMLEYGKLRLWDDYKDSQDEE